MNTSLELLRRIDEKDYLTEREHKEFLQRLIKELEEKEKQKEILNILKRKAYFYPVNEKVASIQINITTCDDNFGKVEEWLNNGKTN